MPFQSKFSTKYFQTKMEIELELMQVPLSIAKVTEYKDLLKRVEGARFVSMTKTDEEISLVVDSDKLPEHKFVSAGWRAMRIIGPLDFSLVGVLQKILEPLAQNGISVFTISTFVTDYLLIRQEQLQKAVELLSGALKSVKPRRA